MSPHLLAGGTKGQAFAAHRPFVHNRYRIKQCHPVTDKTHVKRAKRNKARVMYAKSMPSLDWCYLLVAPVKMLVWILNGSRGADERTGRRIG